MRNTVRFCSEPARLRARTGLPLSGWWRSMLGVERTRELQAEIEAAYRDYQST